MFRFEALLLAFLARLNDASAFVNRPPSFVQSSASVFAKSATELKHLSVSLVTVGARIGQISEMEQSGIRMAYGYLSEIVEAAKTARAYLEYLEEVAQAARSYLEDLESSPSPVTGSSRGKGIGLPEPKDPGEVREYLQSVEKATTAAQDYLNYLEQVAHDVRTKLDQLTGSIDTVGYDEETTHAVGYLTELEQTVKEAKDYLNYLKGVADSVRTFLTDPQTTPLSEFITIHQGAASDESVQTPTVAPAAPVPAGGDYLSALGGGPVRKMPPRGKPKTASKGTGYLDNMGSTTATPVFSTSPAANVPSPYPAPVTSAPASGPGSAWSSKDVSADSDYLSALGGGSVRKIPSRGKPKMATKGTGYLDNMGSAASPSYSTPVASTWASPALAAAAPAAQPAPAWSSTPPAASASVPNGGDYLSALGSGPVKKMPPRGLPKTVSKGMGYLDNMGSAASPSYSTPAVSQTPAAQPAAAWSSTPPAATASVPSGGDYLSALGGGPVKKMPPRGVPKTASKGMGYLDNMGSAPSPSYSTFAVSPAPAAQPAPAWSSTPPAAGPSVAAGGDYLSALGGGPVKKMPSRGVPKTASKRTGYLDNMGSAASPSYSTPSGSRWESPAPAAAVPAAQPAPAWSSTPSAAGSSIATGGDYLSALGGGPVKKMPPRGLPKTSTKGTGYLENMGRAAPPKDWSSQSGQPVASTTSRIPQAWAPEADKLESKPKTFSAPRRKVADAADPNWLSTVPALRGSRTAVDSKRKLASGLGRKVPDGVDTSWKAVMSTVPSTATRILASSSPKKKVSAGGRLDDASPKWSSSSSNSVPGSRSRQDGRSLQSGKASVPTGADYLASLGGSPDTMTPLRGKSKTAITGSGYLENMGSAAPERSASLPETQTDSSRKRRGWMNSADSPWTSAIPEYGRRNK